MVNEDPSSLEEHIEKGPKDLRYVYFEDNPAQFMLLPLTLRKKWYLNIIAHNTSDTALYPPDATAATEKEKEIIERADIVITDVNDSPDITNRNGGTRRGRYALSQWKKVIFVTGNPFNEEDLGNDFRENYSGSYVVLFKPFEIWELEKAILSLVEQSW